MPGGFGNLGLKHMSNCFYIRFNVLHCAPLSSHRPSLHGKNLRDLRDLFWVCTGGLRDLLRVCAGSLLIHLRGVNDATLDTFQPFDEKAVARVVVIEQINI